MKLLDLFSGIGGFSLAAQRAGFEIKKHYASEIDKYAQMIYRRNFNGSIQLGDVTGIGDDLGEIDIITGGFPCQAFSIAGKRRGFDDTRGTLFFEIERLAWFYGPSYMVLENVKGLFSHEKGNTIRIILDKLRRLDYSVQLLLLNTKDFGIPQNRERIFFICTARGKRQPEISGIRERKTEVDGTDVKTIPVLSPDRVEKRQNGRRFKENGDPSFTLTAQDRHGVLLSDSGISRKRELRNVAPPLRAHDGCGHDNYCVVENQRNELRKMNISPTLQASSSGKIGQSPPVVNFQNSIIRRLTPKECERLQDYPDNWTKYGIDENGKEVEISDTQRYKTCGNSISVIVAKEIFKEIKKVYS